MIGLLRLFGVLAWIAGLAPFALLMLTDKAAAAWNYAPTMLGALLGGVLLFAVAEGLARLHSIDKSLKRMAGASGVRSAEPAPPPIAPQPPRMPRARQGDAPPAPTGKRHRL